MNRFLWPLIGFVVLVGFLAAGLNLNPRDIGSPLDGKLAPTFALAQVSAPDKTFAPRDMLGKVWLLNVWATWCVSCREEHPLLVELAKDPALTLVGLNYKEVRGDGSLDAEKMDADSERQLALRRAQEWLSTRGDPYRLSVLDLDGRVGIDYGVYGVPETFVIDRAGVIRYKHAGPLTAQVYDEQIRPLIKELEK